MDSLRLFLCVSLGVASESSGIGPGPFIGWPDYARTRCPYTVQGLRSRCLLAAIRCHDGISGERCDSGARQRTTAPGVKDRA